MYTVALRITAAITVAFGITAAINLVPRITMAIAENHCVAKNNIFFIFYGY